MQLLVIEDEVKTGDFLRRGFSEAGFAVTVATDGAEGMRLIDERAFGVIVLDVLLPRVNGWQVLDWLRTKGVHTPVVILTAKDAVSDRVKGLQLGADDYLVKPFAFSELLARVRTILRRPPVRESPVLDVGDLQIDTDSFKAVRSGRRLDLTAREFALLSLLARRAGEVLTRALIAQAVWGIDFRGDSNVVDVSVRRLRTKLDDPFPNKMLRTVRGVGYVLEIPE